MATVQVSLGSNDEFFASDKDEKISSRDSPAPAPVLATDQAPPLTPDTPSRKKAHTVSSSMPEEVLLQLDPKPTSPRLIRRQTESYSRADFRTETSKVDKRKSLVMNGAIVRQSWGEKKILPRLQARNMEASVSRRAMYVDAGVQTESVDCCDPSRMFQNEEPKIVYVYVEARNRVPIGSMQEFCRQVSLGDALGYV